MKTMPKTMPTGTKITRLYATEAVICRFGRYGDDAETYVGDVYINGYDFFTQVNGVRVDVYLSAHQGHDFREI